MFGLGKRKGQYAERYEKIGAGRPKDEDAAAPADDDVVDAEILAEDHGPEQIAPAMPDTPLPVILPTAIDGQAEPPAATNSVPDPEADGLAWGHDHCAAKTEDALPSWLDLAEPRSAEEQLAPFIDMTPQELPETEEAEPVVAAVEVEPEAMPPEPEPTPPEELPGHVSAVAVSMEPVAAVEQLVSAVPPEGAAPESALREDAPAEADLSASDPAVQQVVVPLPEDEVPDTGHVAAQISAVAAPAETIPAEQPIEAGKKSEDPPETEVAVQPAAATTQTAAPEMSGHEIPAAGLLALKQAAAAAAQAKPAVEADPVMADRSVDQPELPDTPAPAVTPDPAPAAQPAAPDLSEDELLELGIVVRQKASRRVTRPTSADGSAGQAVVPDGSVKNVPT